MFEDQSAAAELGRRAAREIRGTHSAAAAGATMARRLDALQGIHPVARPEPVGSQLATFMQRGPVAPPRSSARFAGPLLRRITLRMMKPFTAYQRTINEDMVRLLQGLERTAIRTSEAQQREEAARLADARRSDVTLTRLARDVESLEVFREPIRERFDYLSDRLEDLRLRLDLLDSERRAVPFMEGTPFELSSHPTAGIVQGYGADTAGPHSDNGDQDAYRSFEDIFRGSEEFIRQRQRKFIALIDGREPVLDFGCGRGEFLDLLREAGLSYEGVDSDPGMVKRCRDKGHERVELADGVDYLQGLEPGSLGAVFCAQVIEHMPYEELNRFFSAARRALRADGLLIAETVNPHSPPALKAFWVDLTHQHPIFPEVALALCRSAGFEEAFVFHPNGRGDIEVDRYSTGEYAVVARAVAPAQRTVASIGRS
jgi:SAM-dependent methyltransferase